MLLHWMQTRWMTGLTIAPGWVGLFKPPEGGTEVFSVVLSVDMGGF
jgi:hypothetical protein